MDISVFTKQQNPLIDIPPHRASRTLAKLVVGAVLAKRIGQNAIQMMTDEPWKSVKVQARTGIRQHRISGYIPDKMPPREIPNTFFQEPRSYQWQLDHRTVTFMTGRISRSL